MAPNRREAISWTNDDPTETGMFYDVNSQSSHIFNARNADEVDDNGYETRKCERGEKGSAAINGNSNMNITVSYVHESCPD